MLQGRNIRKWIYNDENTFLIQTGYYTNIRRDYPSIFNHLQQFREKLEVRADQGLKWWNLRACTYYHEFEKEKIVWGLTSDRWTFAYDNKGHYLPSNGYILTSTDLSIKYLLAVMNSALMEFYFGFIGIMTAGGAYTLKYETVIEFPIKKVSKRIQNSFIKLVDKILYIKNEDTQADVESLEQTIDVMVYKLYELSYEEVRVIDPDFWLSEDEYESLNLD